MKIIPGSSRRRHVVRVGIFLIAVILIAAIPGCTGTPGAQIRDWYDLDAVRNNLGGSYILMNDLDSTTSGYEELASPKANEGQGWQPVGSLDDPDPFTGSFDGRGYEIRYLFINRPGELGVGLFGAVGEGGHIEDIGVVNADVTGFSAVGGLVGINDRATVSDSYSTGNVTGDLYVGGLMGGNGLGTVSNSYSTGSVTGSKYVGGLVGQSYDSTVSNSYSTGSITGNEYVGGLVGVNEKTTVSNSYSTGSVTGGNETGGLVGRNINGTVSDSFWDTETSGQSVSGGGTGKNTTEMQNIATFSGAGWNIISVALNETNPAYIWNIVNNVTYPFLSWQL